MWLLFSSIFNFLVDLVCSNTTHPKFDLQVLRLHGLISINQLQFLWELAHSRFDQIPAALTGISLTRDRQHEEAPWLWVSRRHEGTEARGLVKLSTRVA